ncbi:Citrate-binding protein [Dichanthelium oligosanthes]|uniref:Citrate-binding protein n=1 Tax=Dichanthelium oligosanthes TaxID=888268 RepID=A0A1E5W3K2_9POAL|nr:Citrate-binding protein [Dichanthelium oligosanthes]
MASCFLPWLLLMFMALASSCYDRSFAIATADPTLGLTAIELTEDRFKLHKPYDLPPEQRYEFRDGLRRMWVYCDDKPFSPGSPTKPRSEILLNATYTGGVWQFEGYGYVPVGTSGRNTTLMLHVYGGRLMHYHDETRVVDTGIYDRWFRLNVVHDVDAGVLTVFIDDEERLAVAGHGGYRHYFKFGVYTQTDPSHYMESRWRDVKVYTKI